MQLANDSSRSGAECFPERVDVEINGSTTQWRLNSPMHTAINKLVTFNRGYIRMEPVSVFKNNTLSPLIPPTSVLALKPYHTDTTQSLESFCNFAGLGHHPDSGNGSFDEHGRVSASQHVCIGRSTAGNHLHR